MGRTFLSACVVALALLAPATAAHAAITVTYSGGTVGITGTGDNTTFVGFTTTFNPAGTVYVRNSSGMTNNTGGQCTTENNVPLGMYIHCPGAATNALNATYGAGNDEITFEGVCIPQETVALGEGSNRLQQNSTDGCPADQVLNASAGSGSDFMLGGVGNDTLSGGGGPDQLRGNAGDDTIIGGDGDDELDGQTGNDAIAGGEGDDELAGREGNDAMDGGNGNDVLGWSSDANPGADDLRGGAGFDEVLYESHANGIAVTLDDLANDGSAGEGDNVHTDLEKIGLSRGSDVFFGSPGRDVVDGWGGNDELHGGAGDDDLQTQGGDDKLFGDAGNDKLTGGNGNDTLDGGPGTDALAGDSEKCDAYYCLAGADVLLARDGEVDTVSCGAGGDRAVVDAGDIVANDIFANCESVDRAAAAPTPPGGRPGPGARPATPAAFTKARLTAGKRRFTISLTLRSAMKVTITVTRKGARRALGKVTYTGRKGTFRRTVTKVGNKRLRRGTYRVVIKAGSTSKTLSVKVK